MVKNHNSYYEVVLGVLVGAMAVAFMLDSASVKIFTTLFVLFVYLIKEVFLFLEEKDKKELESKLDAIKEVETQKEIESLKSEINKINFKLFSR